MPTPDVDTRLLLFAADLPHRAPDELFSLSPCRTFRCVDLSPPPLDEQGLPKRLDHFPFMLHWLARSLCLPNLDLGVSWTPYFDPKHDTEKTWIEWELNTDGAQIAFIPHRAFDRYEEVVVPEFEQLKPTEPNIERLSLAALFRARIWTQDYSWLRTTRRRQETELLYTLAPPK